MMKTHSVRHKSKPTPIITLSPPFLVRILSSRPEAASLAIAWLTKSLKELLGRAPVLDHEQSRLLLKKAGADAQGMWVSKFASYPGHFYKLKDVFELGLMSRPSLELEEVLRLAEDFFAMLEQYAEAEGVAVLS